MQNRLDRAQEQRSRRDPGSESQADTLHVNPWPDRNQGIAPSSAGLFSERGEPACERPPVLEGLWVLGVPGVRLSR